MDAGFPRPRLSLLVTAAARARHLLWSLAQGVPACQAPCRSQCQLPAAGKAETAFLRCPQAQIIVQAVTLATKWMWPSAAGSGGLLAHEEAISGVSNLCQAESQEASSTAVASYDSRNPQCCIACWQGATCAFVKMPFDHAQKWR